MMDTGEMRRKGKQQIAMHALVVDSSFVETMDLQILEGSSFSANTPQHAALLNEAAVQAMNLENPLGQKIMTYPLPTVVGVIEDFHLTSLRTFIKPLGLFLMDDPTRMRYLLIKVHPGRLPTTVAAIQDHLQQFAGGYPLDVKFLDEDFNRHYYEEQRLGRAFGIFAGLAIFLACLGLFGLAAYAAERRAKEIGIRKVLGASVTNVVALLSKDFVQLVLIAFVVAVPVAYYAMQRWLEDFAYRIDLSPWIFAGAGFVALVIALVTVSYQALKAALTDPVDAIRYE